MKPTNILIWQGYIIDDAILLQWWSDEQGYGEWRELEISKFSSPNPPNGYKGVWEKK